MESTRIKASHLPQLASKKREERKQRGHNLGNPAKTAEWDPHKPPGAGPSHTIHPDRSEGIHGVGGAGRFCHQQPFQFREQR